LVKLDATEPYEIQGEGGKGKKKEVVSYVRGEAPLLTREDLYQIEQRCIQWQFGHRPDMR